MNEEEIDKVFNFADKRVVKLALDDVNLTEKERLVIENTKMSKRTFERTAEILDISVRNTYRLSKKAIEKIRIAWQYNCLVNLILKNERVG